MNRYQNGSVALDSLDELLTPEECALWLKMEEDTLLENVRMGRIPVVKINSRVLRFHPRTVLLGLGVARETLVQADPRSRKR